MIIDVHGHVSAPQDLYAYKSLLLAGRGLHGKDGPGLRDEQIEASAQGHLKLLRSVGTDIQFISPRPFHLMHSEKPAKIVEWWVRANNDVIATQCRMHPEVFRGVAALPQIAGESPRVGLDELDRCVRDLGFVGCLLNPDPGEGDGQTPPLGDEYWYPLYEKLVELDVPTLIHSAGCKSPRESYSNHFSTEETIAVISLVDSSVFRDFPKLKIIVAHGGGSVPYQIGRWRASRWLDAVNASSHYQREGGGDVDSFDQGLRRLYFDSVLYSRESLELLIKVVGAERVLFGTETPGSGSPLNPDTGRRFDDLKPEIEAIEWLSGDDRQKIFEGNARAIYPGLEAAIGRAAGAGGA